MGGNIDKYPNSYEYNEIPKTKVEATSYAPGKGEILYKSHEKQEKLKKCPDKYKCLNLPKDIIKILKEDDSLKKAGFRFDKTSGQIIYPEGFENQEKIRKIRKFIEVAGWLYSEKAERLKKSNPTRYKIEKYKKYIELTKMDSIIEGVNKKLLQYRYINSIYQDIIDEGFVFKKDKNGNYKLFNPKTGEVAEGPYAKMLLDSRNLNSFDFDFAFISSITSNSAIYNEKGLISQKHTISAILDKHKIVDRSGNRITPTSILLVDWDYILKQVNNKIAHSKKTNLHSYQELMYLKGFIENKDYLSKNRNRTLYKELNLYNKLDGKVNALAAQLEGVKDEKTMMEKLSGIAKELAIPGIALGLLLSIFSGTRGIGKVLLIGGIGGLVGAKVVDAVGKRVDSYSDEDLGLIIPEEVVYSVEAKDKDYSKGIKKLQELNKENLGKSGYTESGEKLPMLKDNKKILDISKDILSLADDPKTKITADDLWAKLQGKARGRYSKEDIKAYLDLLNSEGFSHDPEDKTIRDYLTEGLDIANRPYKNLTVFEGIISGGELAPFDEELNNILKPIYDSTKNDREKRKEFIKVLDTIKKEFSGLKVLDSFASKKANIKAALEKYDPSYKDILDPVFDEYEIYQKSKNILEEYTGLIDGNANDLRLALKKTIGTGSYTEIYSKTENAIRALTSALITDPNLSGKEPFKTLNKEIKATIKELKRTKKDIINAAKKEGINFSKDPIDINTYKTSPEFLYDDMKDVFDEIESVKSNIKSGADIKTELNRVIDDYKWLAKGVAILRGQPTNGGNNIEVLFRQKIQNEIVAKFSTLEDELKKAIIDRLLPIYKENKKYYDIANSLTSNVDINNIENLLKVKNYIDTHKIIGQKAKEDYDEAKRLFSNLQIKDSSGDYSSYDIQKLISVFETKKANLEAAINTYLQNFVPGNTVSQIKEQAKILKAIKNNFPNKRAEVEAKEKLLLKNLPLRNVKNFNTDLKNIANTLTPDKKEVINQFLLGNISYGNLNISNMRVKDFIEMIQNGKLKYGNAKIDLVDVQSLFTNGAIFNALDNL